MPKWKKILHKVNMWVLALMGPVVILAMWIFRGYDPTEMFPEETLAVLISLNLLLGLTIELRRLLFASLILWSGTTIVWSFMFVIRPSYLVVVCILAVVSVVTTYRLIENFPKIKPVPQEEVAEEVAEGEES